MCGCRIRRKRKGKRSKKWEKGKGAKGGSSKENRDRDKHHSVISQHSQKIHRGRSDIDIILCTLCFSSSFSVYTYLPLYSLGHSNKHTHTHIFATPAHFTYSLTHSLTEKSKNDNNILLVSNSAN